MMYLYLIVAIIALTIGHLFQTARWKQFIAIYEEADQRSLLQSLSLGYLLNLLIPFRIGDFFRAIYAGRKMKNGISLSLATVIIGRYLDILFVGLFFILFIFIADFDQRIINSALFYSVTALVLLILSVFFLKKKVLPKWFIRKFAGIFNTQLELRILIFFWCFITAFKDLYLKIDRLKLILNTVMMWFFYAISYYGLALSISELKLHKIEFIDVFMMLFSKGTIDATHFDFSLSYIDSNNILAFSFLLVPLILLFLVSFCYSKKTVIVEDETNYFNMLPHKNKEDKLSFLELYFSTHDSGLIKKYLEITNEVLVLEDFSAGSNATTLLCYNANRNFYRKYAIGSEKDKLYDQILWLDSLKDHLPVTHIEQSRLTDDYCYYDMEYNPSATGLFNYIHSAPLNDSWTLIENVLDTVRVNLHAAHPIEKSSDALKQYIDTKVLENVKKITEKRIIKEVLKYDEIVINGKLYKNLHHFLAYLSADHLQKVFEEDTCAKIHGDLTVENIIVDVNLKQGFYLIDPNAENIHNSDALDYAKLLQSLHGGYEFLMKTNKVTMVDNEISYLFTASSRYEELFTLYKNYLYQHFTPAKVKSIFYHEIVHWLRLLPYKLEKNGERAMLFYAGLVIVLNNVMDEFEKK